MMLRRIRKGRRKATIRGHSAQMGHLSRSGQWTRMSQSSLSIQTVTRTSSITMIRSIKSRRTNSTSHSSISNHNKMRTMRFRTKFPWQAVIWNRRRERMLKKRMERTSQPKMGRSHKMVKAKPNWSDQSVVCSKLEIASRRPLKRRRCSHLAVKLT